MEINWSKIFETSLLHKAEIVKAVLHDHNIDAIILNKQSSTHISLNTNNDIAVFVFNANVVEAKYIITKHEL